MSVDIRCWCRHTLVICLHTDTETTSGNSRPFNSVAISTNTSQYTNTSQSQSKH